ncbi:hypothetical protein [Allostreptomyces psammosilenae]|uniref:Uncharacterized protein n=1 Tax=Allostreptomyces psammosilenae TaxID=1892865 RepID=A0A852ZXX3_9ACTN|nr:hypothetical protein [Allostreptomyces psammosilenae]NYI05574.1 hypothetical protein [Allostreptomyces psammosilenae]
MVLNLSAVFVLGVAVFFLLRARALPAGAGFVAMLFGFFLASTGAAGPINRGVAAFITALSDLTL